MLGFILVSQVTPCKLYVTKFEANPSRIDQTPENITLLRTAYFNSGILGEWKSQTQSSLQFGDRNNKTEGVGSLRGHFVRFFSTSLQKTEPKHAGKFGRREKGHA